MTAIRAYLGGSFDPVHQGHIAMAQHVFLQLSKQFSSQEIYVSLLPTAGNPFKGNPTPAKHRLAMLSLAIHDTPLHISEEELHQTAPVYTIDTVKRLYKRHSNDVLIFIMGKDSLLSLPTWKNAQELFQYINFWVFDRQIEGQIPTWITTHFCQTPDALMQQKGKIYQDNTPIITISSSQIRAWLADDNPKVQEFLPAKVADYIKQHALYR